MGSLYGIILMVLFCMTAFAEKEELKIIGINAPDFALQDAEDKDYKLKEMKDNVVILIMGNRKTRKETDKWAEAIKKDYSRREKVKTFMIADMRGVPWFIPKGFIKGWLKKDKPPVTLLLDWDGKTHVAYATQEKKPNVFIISKVGKIVYRMNANYDDETYKETRSKIKETLAEKQVMEGQPPTPFGKGDK
jgi:peroxiredoxin